MRARPVLWALPILLATLLPRRAQARPHHESRDMGVMLLPSAPGPGDLMVPFSIVDAEEDARRELRRRIGPVLTDTLAVGMGAAAMVATGGPSFRPSTSPRVAALRLAGALGFGAACAGLSLSLARRERVRATLIMGPTGGGLTLTTQF